MYKTAVTTYQLQRSYNWHIKHFLHAGSQS